MSSRHQRIQMQRRLLWCLAAALVLLHPLEAQMLMWVLVSLQLSGFLWCRRKAALNFALSHRDNLSDLFSQHIFKQHFIILCHFIKHLFLLFSRACSVSSQNGYKFSDQRLISCFNNPSALLLNHCFQPNEAPCRCRAHWWFEMMLKDGGLSNWRHLAPFFPSPEHYLLFSAWEDYGSQVFYSKTI